MTAELLRALLDEKLTMLLGCREQREATLAIGFPHRNAVFMFAARTQQWQCWRLTSWSGRRGASGWKVINPRGYMTIDGRVVCTRFNGLENPNGVSLFIIETHTGTELWHRAMVTGNMSQDRKRSIISPWRSVIARTKLTGCLSAIGLYGRAIRLYGYSRTARRTFNRSTRTSTYRQTVGYRKHAIHAHTLCVNTPIVNRGAANHTGIIMMMKQSNKHTQNVRCVYLRIDIWMKKKKKLFDHVNSYVYGLLSIFIR